MQVIRRSRKVNRKDGQSTRCLCLLQEACSSNPEFQAAVDTGPCHFFPALLGLGRIRPWIHSTPAFIHLGARSKVITPLWPLERRWKTRS
ncbi:hypothetical protein Y1Q_0007133 [Alligator mississippiensis]|uniref:Uncharacterized protein n=1 Tax=Alligator mississippiensis TaxID=8496 RepID=A0A151N5Q8_ALLMI|nr:hypothetical protein Y1Q_0007133 [Alligator mississippiensis]